MLTFILPVISAIVCSGIEYLRIKSVHGKVDNVNKLWSVTIGVVFFAVSLACSVSYYDDILPGHVFTYALYYAGCRGLIYDTFLNAFRGLPFDYFSDHTNSLVDKLSRNLGGFWALRLISLLVTIVFGYLWHMRY
jgi:hypothetical protein